MQKLQLEDSPLTVVHKMVEGNIGAMDVVTSLILEPEGVWAILKLDALGFYGPDIWVLYKDECGEDIAKLIERLKTMKEDRDA